MRIPPYIYRWACLPAFSLVAIFTLSAGGLQAAEQGLMAPEQPTTLSKKEVTVGEELLVRVELPEGESFAGAPEISDAPEGVAIKEVRFHTPEGQGGKPAIEARLAIFDLKLDRIPSLLFSYQASDGTAKHVASAPQIISIRRITGEQEKEMMDIRGPQSVSLDWWKYALYLIAILAAGWGLLWWVRRRRRLAPGGEALLPLAPPVPPHERALKALAELERLDLPAQGKIKEHCVRLSEIFREYLEGRFEFLALEQTTDEIRLAFRTVAGVTEREKTAALAILEEWDLVKFAKLPLSSDRAMQSLRETRSWVEETKPSLQQQLANAGVSDAASEAVRRALG